MALGAPLVQNRKQSRSPRFVTILRRTRKSNASLNARRDPLDHFQNARVEGAYSDGWLSDFRKSRNRSRSPRVATLLRRTEKAVENLLGFYEGYGRDMRASTLGLWTRWTTSNTDRVEGAYGDRSSPAAEMKQKQEGHPGPKNYPDRKQQEKEKHETYSSPRESLEQSQILIQGDRIAGLFIGRINMLCGTMRRL